MEILGSNKVTFCLTEATRESFLMSQRAKLESSPPEVRSQGNSVFHSRLLTLEV